MSVSGSVLRPGQLWSRKDYDTTEFRFLILEELLPDGIDFLSSCWRVLEMRKGGQIYDVTWSPPGLGGMYALKMMGYCLEVDA